MAGFVIVLSTRDLMCLSRNFCRSWTWRVTLQLARPSFKAVISALNISWKVQQLNRWRILLFCAVVLALADWAEVKIVKLSSSESDSSMSRAADAILHLTEIETHSMIDQRLKLSHLLEDLISIHGRLLVRSQAWISNQLQPRNDSVTKWSRLRSRPF
jgi:hypothetical protein